VIHLILEFITRANHASVKVGTSAEGSTLGTPNEMAAIQGVNIPVAEQLKFYDAWGSDLTTPHMAVGWTWAFDTPFKWTKQGIALRRHPAGHGHLLAWPHHGYRRHPYAVPPHH
jgi:hypothetical protein